MRRFTGNAPPTASSVPPPSSQQPRQRTRSCSVGRGPTVAAPSHFPLPTQQPIFIYRHHLDREAGLALFWTAAMFTKACVSFSLCQVRVAGLRFPAGSPVDAGEQWLLSAFFSSHSKSNSSRPSNGSACVHLSVLLLSRSSPSSKLPSTAIKNQVLWAHEMGGYTVKEKCCPKQLSVKWGCQSLWLC